MKLPSMTHGLVFGAAAIATTVFATYAARAEISKVVAGHVGTDSSQWSSIPTDYFPLQTGLNKITIQGSVALSTAKFVSTSPLKATSKIVARGTNYLHVNITVSDEASNGQTGDGVILQPVSAGSPDKFRWKVYSRGTVTQIAGPREVRIGDVKKYTFIGKNMGNALLDYKTSIWSIVKRESRSATAVSYLLRFENCSASVRGARISSSMLRNDGLPQRFRGSNRSFAKFLGGKELRIRVKGGICD